MRDKKKREKKACSDPLQIANNNRQLTSTNELICRWMITETLLYLQHRKHVSFQGEAFSSVKHPHSTLRLQDVTIPLLTWLQCLQR